ncbi:MAG TPA: FAD-dependent thymidylate synthase, partial [Bryobacteraceae bacterium]|nr:FAD-dependent thymidylate synthase [Bryobacteraceae bacterium]
EVEDEQLWDGQARSSRYQDFSKSGFVTPPEFDSEQAAAYQAAAGKLLDGYNKIHVRMCDYLAEQLPRPESMKPDAYQRNLKARAFDVARYLLCFGIPTGVGQVTSIRTLERQVRRLKASEYAEVRELAGEIAAACAAPPSVPWNSSRTFEATAQTEAAPTEAVAPTLARHVAVNEHLLRSREDLQQWARENLPESDEGFSEAVDLLKPVDTLSDIVATLLYPVTHRSYRALYEMARAWSGAQKNEVIEVALRSRTARDELLRNFRCAPYVYDIVMDIGAYRDLHRHRRCQQFRQSYSRRLGFETPDAIEAAGLSNSYHLLMSHASNLAGSLPDLGSHYLLPFATRSRFLFKMDFAETEYISRLRSGVKGHFSYRRIAWQMKEKMLALEPELGRLMEATPPWVDDPLQR